MAYTSIEVETPQNETRPYAYIMPHPFPNLLVPSMPADPIILRRFTVRDYYAMADAGILDSDERVELLDGKVVAMSPIGARHADRVSRLAEWLVHHTPGIARVRIQCPVRLDDHSEPEPDIALVDAARDYNAAHPGPEDVFLVIEISDSTLKKDLRVKVPLYARAGIPEVWVVALEEDRVYVFRDPAGDAYRFEAVVGRGDTIHPPAVPLLGAVSVTLLLG